MEIEALLDENLTETKSNELIKSHVVSAHVPVHDRFGILPFLSCPTVLSCHCDVPFDFAHIWSKC